ncbi:hypothetical protein AB0C22_04760 [Micromonospora sp. NPDC048894]|uniref:hypothetical protein n=1 Tax=unclassified Micromonospora TaxID=2617518 RepID=UPI0033DB6A35
MRTPRSILSTQLFDLPNRSANTCCDNLRRPRQYATRRPTGNNSLLSTTPPPVGYGPGGLLGRYPFGVGLGEKPLPRLLVLRRLDLLASARCRLVALVPHVASIGRGAAARS